MTTKLALICAHCKRQFHETYRAQRYCGDADCTKDRKEKARLKYNEKRTRRRRFKKKA